MAKATFAASVMARAERVAPEMVADARENISIRLRLIFFNIFWVSFSWLIYILNILYDSLKIVKLSSVIATSINAHNVCQLKSPKRLQVLLSFYLLMHPFLNLFD